MGKSADTTPSHENEQIYQLIIKDDNTNAHDVIEEVAEESGAEIISTRADSDLTVYRCMECGAVRESEGRIAAHCERHRGLFGLQFPWRVGDAEALKMYYEALNVDTASSIQTGGYDTDWTVRGRFLKDVGTSLGVVVLAIILFSTQSDAGRAVLDAPAAISQTAASVLLLSVGVVTVAVLAFGFWSENHG